MPRRHPPLEKIKKEVGNLGSAITLIAADIVAIDRRQSTICA